MSQQRLIQASAAALWIASSPSAAAAASAVEQRDDDEGIVSASARYSSSTTATAMIQVTICTNDQPGPGQDSGCPTHQPICVTKQAVPASLHKNETTGNNLKSADEGIDKGNNIGPQAPEYHEPPHNGKGINCVPCLSYYENPVEPDWGCTAAQPLCVDDDQKRPASFGTAGTRCADYPCRRRRSNQKEQKNEEEEDGETVGKTKVIPDEGCSVTHPKCVNALGTEPPAGQPGVECVATSRQPRHRQNQTRKSAGSHDAGTDAFGLGTKTTSSSSTSSKSWGGIVLDSLVLMESRQQPASPTTTTNTQAFRGLDNEPREQDDEDGGKKKNRCLILAGDVEPLPWNKPGQIPLCNGCPFGISKQCAIGSKLSW